MGGTGGRSGTHHRGLVTYGCVRAGSGAAKGTRVPLTAVGTLEPLPG
ncbi:hypothetical protein GCM10010287_32110 [Streptomyces variabilis]|uniref:Uncharacterized protein n=1 Tax=Streptomyces variabilis TaxID=67372 RepID=A0ABQ2TYX8_9ACTN|nr:hypothetical protein GCM10010265_09920 [Streptomyces griseoincarnatus]GGT55568.1 hypothetical protein GCM10010287_32110 [Streptomyces variabilis]